MDMRKSKQKWLRKTRKQTFGVEQNNQLERGEVKFGSSMDLYTWDPNSWFNNIYTNSSNSAHLVMGSDIVMYTGVEGAKMFTDLLNEYRDSTFNNTSYLSTCT